MKHSEQVSNWKCPDCGKNVHSLDHDCIPYGAKPISPSPLLSERPKNLIETVNMVVVRQKPQVSLVAPEKYHHEEKGS